METGVNRRKLIIGGAALIAAPAIVRAEWLMPVKVIEPVMGWQPGILFTMRPKWSGIQEWMPPNIAYIEKMVLQEETQLYHTWLRKGNQSIQGYISKEYLEDRGGFAAEEMFERWTAEV